MSNDHGLIIPPNAPRVPAPQAAPRQVIDPAQPAGPYAPQPPDRSMFVPPVTGTPGDRPAYVPPTVMQGNVGFPAKPGLPAFDAPALSPATARDPNPGLKMGSHAAGAQTMIDTYRVNFDPAHPANAPARDPFASADPRVRATVRR